MTKKYSQLMSPEYLDDTDERLLNGLLSEISKAGKMDEYYAAIGKYSDSEPIVAKAAAAIEIATLIKEYQHAENY